MEEEERYGISKDRKSAKKSTLKREAGAAWRHL
jgi:hypothetical protein